jgi:CRP-like cAMP-binding protein
MVVLWIPLASIDREAKAPDPETLAFVRRLPIFAPLPPPAIERILAHITPLDVPAGEVFIREGDVGERFFMIVDGKAEVTRDGAHVTYRTAGEHVGEIALLRDVPRTATVTAITPMKLLILDREAFLEAVTGHPQSHERAQAIVEDRLPPKSLDP